MTSPLQPVILKAGGRFTHKIAWQKLGAMLSVLGMQDIIQTGQPAWRQGRALLRQS
ncbi:MAG: hypothetical protein ABSG78_08150 [Verrucomicrobiota bacterium]